MAKTFDLASRHGRSSLMLVLTAIMLGGCATFSKDGGLDQVSSITNARTGQSIALPGPAADPTVSGDTVGALLRQPLTPDTAVQVALLNNRGLRAALAELGVAEADLVRAGRMRNPGFSFGRMSGGGDVEIERSIMFDLMGLFTIPLRTEVEGRRFEQSQLRAASQAVRLATDTRKAWFNAVAAQQSVEYASQVQSAAQASAELAARMAAVGNFSKLDQAREQAFYADAAAQMARARHNATAAREQLARLLGVWGRDIAFQLPQRLPALPAAADSIADIESLAMRQRLDIQLARSDAQMTASALGLTRATGFVNVLHAGYANKSQTGSARENGYEIELELPIFDWGTTRNARAEALYMQSVHRTADTAIRARSEVRESYSAYRTAHDLAIHYRDEVIPLRKRISEEMMLRYNGMLVSVFELLADARAQVSSVNAAIEAQRDYWLAQAELQAAIHGTGGTSTPLRGTAVAGDAGAAH